MTTDQAPDPRLARTDARLRAAAAALLAESGYRGVTIEAVAARSGVAKTTIYRRWSTKAEMVYALLLRSAPTLPEVGGTGGLEDDIATLVERTLAFVADEPGRSILPGLVGDMSADEALAARFREEVVAGARPLIQTVLDAAASRDDVVADVTARELQAALVGTAFLAVHLMGDYDRAALRRTLSNVASGLVRPQQPGG